MYTCVNVLYIKLVHSPTVTGNFGKVRSFRFKFLGNIWSLVTLDN